MSESRAQVKLPDEAATAEFGHALAHALQPAPKGPVVIYLEGTLGAGKTSLARSVLRNLGVTGTVRSPTYTLMEIYEIAGLTVVHLDLYRLTAADELEALGLRDFLEPGNVWLVEWPERGVGGLPQADVNIELRIDGEGRIAGLQGLTEEGKRLLSSAGIQERVLSP